MSDDDLIALAEEANDLYDRGAYDAAYDLAFRVHGALARVDEAQAARLRPMILNLIGSILSETGSLQPAIRLFREAARLYEGRGDLMAAATTMANLGNTYRYANNWNDAVAAYRASIEKAQAAGGLAVAATSSVNLLHFYNGLGLDIFDGSAEYAPLFEAVDGAPSLPPQVARAVLALKLIKAKREQDHQTTGTLMLRMTRLGRDLGTAYRAEAYLDLASFLVGRSRRKMARRFLAEAVRLFTEIGDHRLKNALVLLGEIARHEHDWDGVEQANLAALALAAKEYEGLDPGVRHLHAERFAELARHHIDMLIECRRFEQAVMQIETWIGRVDRDLTFRQQRKRQGGRRIRVGASGRLFLDPPSFGDMVALAAERSLHVLRLYAMQNGKLFFCLIGPDAAPVFELIDNVVLMRWSSSGSQEDPETVLDLLDEPHAGRVQLRRQAGSVPPFLSVSLKTISNGLLQSQIGETLRSGRGSLLVLTDADFMALPLTALSLDDGEVLADRWAISRATSLGLFEQLDPSRDAYDPPGDADPARFLELIREVTAVVVSPDQHSVVVDPAPGRPEFRQTLVFPALPGAGEEAIRIAALDDQVGGTTVVLGPSAGKLEVLWTLRRCNVAHFATHGYSAATNGWASFLLLGDGDILPVSELMIDGYTSARIVVMSACDTGKDYFNPDSALGLTSAFIVAGAKVVVSTLWPIDDAATVAFMTVFHRELRVSDRVDQAFKAAIDAMRANPATADPYYWAPFQLSGDPFAPRPIRKIAGPVLRGGGIVTRQAVGTYLDLESLRDLTHRVDEGVIINPDGEIIRSRMPRGDEELNGPDA